MFLILNLEPMKRDMDWGEPKHVPYEDYPYLIRIRKGHELTKDDRWTPRVIDLTGYHKWAERHGLDMRHSLFTRGNEEDYKHLIAFFFRKKSEAMFFKLVFYRNEAHRRIYDPTKI